VPDKHVFISVTVSGYMLCV